MNYVVILKVTNLLPDDSHARMTVLMPSLLDRYLNCTRDVINYVIVVTLFIVLSYSVNLMFGEDTIVKLGKEDGFFEYLTAIFFLVASMFFIKIWFSYRNGWFLLLAIVFFIGCGEEISWGQRIFGYSTLDLVKSIDVQKEMTLHNINVINVRGNPGKIARLHTIEGLYKLFCLTYCVLLPIAAFHIRSIFSITEKVRLPIPPLPIGIFFLINWITFKIISSIIVSLDNIHWDGMPYYYTSVEIMECISAFIFMMLSIYFYNRIKLQSHKKLINRMN